MKNKFFDLITTILFCGFVGVMLVLFLLLPKDDFSELEKRALAVAPDTSAKNVLSGQYGEEAESYIADHLPGRDFFVGVANYYDLLSGRQATKEILLAKGDRLVEKPNVANTVAAQRNMNAINSFAQTVGQQVDLMIVPSAGFVLEDSILGIHAPYTDDAIIADIYDLAGAQVSTLELYTRFKQMNDPEAMYYRTDHHWTALGAYRAYAAYMEQKGRNYKQPEEYTVETHAGFFGTTHSRSGLWLVQPDTVELWKDGVDYQVTTHNNAADTAGKLHGGLFYRQRLLERDMYTVYLDGNQPLVRIHNPEGEGRLLVIRDSYANCLGTFLAGSYEEVVLVDLRYWKTPVSELVAAEPFDDILVCYSLYNFLTDVNFPWLK